jgi:hypothetical protein
MRARLSHRARVEAQVWARDELGSLVGHGRERRREFTGGANGGRRRTVVLLGGTRGKAGGYRPTTLQGGFAELSLATVTTAWARRRLAMRGGRRPMEGGGSRAGECGVAA